MTPNSPRLRIVSQLSHDRASLKRNKLLASGSYYGGKRALVSKYIPLFPEHTTYVEPFGGSGTVLLSKPRAKIEVYNDLEEGVYSLHACLRDEQLSSQLMRQLKLTPYSRQEHANCIATYGESTTLVEKARKWFVATQASYGSILGETFSTSPNKSRAVEWDRKIDRFEPVIERMRGVTVENRDFENVLRKWNSAETFNFIDPPYVHGTRSGGGGYRHEMSDSEHLRLLSVIKSLDGLVMLCGYANELYDEALKGWRTVDTDYRCSSGRTKAVSRRIERIWMNYVLE